MSWKMMLHFSIIIDLESPHAGRSATDMIIHWSLDWDLGETVGRSEREDIVTACKGLISSLKKEVSHMWDN